MTIPPLTNKDVADQLKAARDKGLSVSDKLRVYKYKERLKRVQALHSRFKPHEGQVDLGKNIFSRGKKFVWGQCGRSWGKSYFGTYAAVRVALTHQNAKVYIVLPERQQAQEIIWESGYLRQMIPEQYLRGGSAEKAYNKSELRVSLANGSFIKLLGSDNPDSLRGIKPHFVIFDEFRDFKSDAFDIMEPNLGINDATLLILSTPPNNEGSYTALREHFLEEAAKKNSEYFYLELPTETNPYYPASRLAATKATLLKRGEASVWLREYMAQFIPGGANSVFKKFQSNKKHICKSGKFMTALVHRDRKKLEWYDVYDPAQNSVFACLFAAINKYTGQIFIFDELYERDNENTGAVDMWNRSKKIKERLFDYPERWIGVYDEAEAWFYNDLDRNHILEPWENLEPTHKRLRDKKEDMSTLKDLFSSRSRIFIASSCIHLIWEIENYATNSDGEYKKKDDHLIDCLRYLIAAADFEVLEYPEPEDLLEELDKNRSRAKTLKEMFDERNEEENFATGNQDEVIYLDDIWIH